MTLINCQWVEGDWRSLDELELTFEAINDMNKVLGEKRLFSTAMRWEPVRFYHVSTDYIYDPNKKGAYSLNNVILPNNVFNSTDGWAKGQIVHELAHVIDFRQWWPPFRLSNGMAALTKSFKDGLYVNTGEAAPNRYAQSHLREDWAESFKYVVYPSFGYLGPIRKDYIEDAIKNYWVP
ncbi:hypothetical protein [Candidatus Villigracilis saccharophilus]|uniref:hypothetical protein n=1 Tax=Candidatus Villigracilis saccharophilus TaxID=3140684 RepID=UPI003136F3DD|nr:hypothetical protein [Anaerolineales bacterium]